MSFSKPVKGQYTVHPYWISLNIYHPSTLDKGVQCEQICFNDSTKKSDVNSCTF